MFRGGFIRRAVRSNSLRADAIRIGREQGFCGAIHWRDHLMHHVLDHSGTAAGLREYFAQGASDARQIVSVMQGLGRAHDSRVLEFASGYGRVTRHLHLSNLTACDIHLGAVSFLRRKMRVTAIQSTRTPSDFHPIARYDFIFVLSLFSHLPERLFERWLAKLASLLNPGGHMMFTTNSETSIAMVARIAAGAASGSNFSFLPDTDQPDLPTAIYGTAIVRSAYVREIISRSAPHCDFVSHRPGLWWQTQDEWIIRCCGSSIR